MVARMLDPVLRLLRCWWEDVVEERGVSSGPGNGTLSRGPGRTGGLAAVGSTRSGDER